jgi:hypothetical protein
MAFMAHRFVSNFTLLLTLLLVACATEQHVVKDTWGDFERSVKGEKFRYGDRETEQSRRMASRSTMSEPGDDKATDLLRPQAQEYWSILLASFTGTTQQKQASDMVDQLKRENVSDVWFAEQDGYTHVYRGKFNDPTRPEVQSALRQSRMLKLGDARPFTSARLVAARPALEISTSQMDLKRYRDQGYYSLQIAVYDDAAGSNYKELAEVAAANLRKDGDMAFFYHGPFRSMVTIGLYTYDQAWTKRMSIGDTYSPEIRKLQEKYPFNLYNSRTIIEKVDGKKVREQPSFLVPVK